MGSYDNNWRRGVFRSGELNTETAIPSLGGIPEASASERRSETAMRGAAARIVEIGGQFDTQHLLDPVAGSPKLQQVTPAGNTLRERAARFHAMHAKESRKTPEGRQDAGIELSGSGDPTTQSSPSQGPGSGSMGGGIASTLHGRDVARQLPEGKRHVLSLIRRHFSLNDPTK